MAYLTTTELTDIRSAMEATLPDTCTITYRTPTTDGAGHTIQTETSRGTAIACRFAPAGAGDFSGISQEQLREGAMWIVSLAYDQMVALSDKATVGGRNYEVIGINTDESEVFLKRVKVTRWA